MFERLLFCIITKERCSQDCCGQKKIALSICGISVCWDGYAQNKAGITDDRYESDLVKKTQNGGKGGAVVGVGCKATCSCAAAGR